MKFKCGECSRLYMLSDQSIPAEGIIIQCKQCTNDFTINANKAFFSSTRNSEVICDNCGNYVEESRKQCAACNMLLNKAHEELRIDNKYYESLDEPSLPSIDQPEQPVTKQGSNSKKTVVLGSIAACFVLIGGFFLLATYTDVINPAISTPFKKVAAEKKQNIETNVVILKTGETYYVKEIEKEGGSLHLVHLSGARNTVDEADVLTITRAVIEKKF